MPPAVKWKRIILNDKNLSYSFLISGKMHYMKAALDPFENKIDKLFNSTDWHYNNDEIKNNPVFYINKTPTADAGISTGLALGIIAFAGGWSANKALDELYEHKLKPAVIDFFEQVNENVKSETTRTLEYQNMVWYKEHEILVMVRIKAKSAYEIEENFDLIIQTHKHAMEWIKTKGKQANIHEYSIESGIVNVKPNLFNSLDHIQSEERVETIKKMHEYIGTLNKT